MVLESPYCLIVRKKLSYNVASVPRSFLLCSLVCVQYNTCKRKSTKKRRKPGNTYHVNDDWWTRGGRRQRGPHSNNVLDSSIKHSNDSQDSRRSRDQQYSTLLVRNTLCGYCTQVCSWAEPPMSTLRPCHMISVPRSSPFFATLPLPCECKLKNKKTGEAWERGYCTCTCIFPGLPTVQF